MAIGGIGNSAHQGITQANVTGMRQKMAEKMATEMDTDKSGSVSKEEFVAFGEKLKAQAPKQSAGSGGTAPTMPSADKLFSAADANGDQSLSVDELSSMLAKAETQGPAGAMRGGPPPGGPPPGGMGGAGGAKGSPGGKASSESHSSSTSKTTNPADTNKDGTVSAAEQLVYDMTHSTASAKTSST